DLAHVEPADLMPDTVGKGVAAESKFGEANLREPDTGAGAEVAAIMQRVASQGFVRNRLTVLQGGAKRPAGRDAGGRDAGARAETRSEAEMPLFAGALAVATIETTTDQRLDQIREARMKGYEGDSCG